MTTPDLTSKVVEELRRLAEKAGGGTWHHCQPFMTVPAQQTIHGRVPAERVDYVSTWQGPGTPPGHRVIVPMADRPANVRSDDMAYIAAANPAVILALLARLSHLEEQARKDGADGLRDKQMDIVEAAIELVWPGIESGFDEGPADHLRAVVAEYQIATGAAEEAAAMTQARKAISDYQPFSLQARLSEREGK